MCRLGTYEGVQRGPPRIVYEITIEDAVLPTLKEE